MFSCKEEKPELDIEEQSPNKELSLFDNYFFLNREFDDINFPIWFNTSYIQEKKIEEIHLKFFYETDSLMSKELKFDFSPEGNINKYFASLYSSNQRLLEVKFDYKKAPDSLGYNEFLFTKVFSRNFSDMPQFLDIFTGLDDFNSEKVEEFDKGIIIRKPKSQNEKWTVHILDSTKQNISAVDQLQNESDSYQIGEAYFVYGTPQKPKKSFFVENMVEKSHLCTYNYFSNGFFKEHTTKFENYFIQQSVSIDSLERIDSWMEKMYSIDTTLIGSEVVDFIFDGDNMLRELDIKSGFDENNLSLRKKIAVEYKFNENNEEKD